jgi:multiple sugar transport system substrate-binding protein/raffinose/stachyose/melibiose transport system substrate-binding protein
MKKGVLILCVLTIVLCTPLFASGNQEKADAPVEINLMHDKSGAPGWVPYFDHMSEITTEKTGYGFMNTVFPATDIYMAQVRSSLPTTDAPNMFTWWSTYRMKELADAGLLKDLSPLWDKYEDSYGKDLRNAFTFGGETYGFPINAEYWPVWYNKEIFADLGLEVPTTWEEYTAVCDTLLEAGITPMLSTIEGRWPTFIFFEEMIIGESPDLYVDLCEGRVKYSDPRVVNAFKKWGELIKKGYFSNPGSDVWAEGAARFNQKEVGMILMGTWYYTSTLLANGVPEETIGAFILPSHNPDAGKNIILEIGPLLVAKNARNMDETLEIIDYWMSPEGNAAFVEQLRSFPGNPAAEADFLPEVMVDLLSEINNDQVRLLNRYWEATPTPICEVAVDEFARFMTDPDSLDTVIKNLDKVADEYWASVK